MQRTSPTYQDLLACVSQDQSPDWERIQAFWPDRFSAMAECHQDPRHHAEGDVLTHTKMVVSELVRDPDYIALPPHRQSALFWCAVLHDIGKPGTTQTEDDGSITSRGHSKLGASITREVLRAAGAPFAWREEICGLITSHQLPFWLIEREDPERLAMQVSWTCNTHDLCLHARADAKGRICSDKQDVLERVALAELTFRDANCFGARRAFANDSSRLSCFLLPDRDPNYAEHEEFYCLATMMSGLPGSGKDTWISNNARDIPVISLDEIRIRMGLKPTDNQGVVIQTAKEEAREHLRAGRDFIWNATNITRQLREPLLALFRGYGARTRIVYVEADPRDHLKQNARRDAAVPQEVIEKLARKLEPPSEIEAHEVVRCVSK